MKLLAQDRNQLGRVCANCPKTPPDPNTRFKVCSGCKWLYFCSTECQHALWASHKALCGLQCTLLAPENPREREFLGLMDKAQKGLGGDAGKKWEQESLQAIAAYLVFVRQRVGMGNGELPRDDRPEAVALVEGVFEQLQKAPADFRFQTLVPFVYEIVMNTYAGRASWRDVLPEALRNKVDISYPAIPDARYMTVFVAAALRRYRENVEAWSQNEQQLKNEQMILGRAGGMLNELVLGRMQSIESNESIPSLHQAMAGISDPAYSGVSNLGHYGNINLQKQFIAFGGAAIAEEFMGFKHVPELYSLGQQFDLTVGSFADAAGYIKYKSF